MGNGLSGRRQRPVRGVEGERIPTSRLGDVTGDEQAKTRKSEGERKVGSLVGRRRPTRMSCLRWEGNGFDLIERICK